MTRQVRPSRKRGPRTSREPCLSSPREPRSRVHASHTHQTGMAPRSCWAGRRGRREKLGGQEARSPNRPLRSHHLPLVWKRPAVSPGEHTTWGVLRPSFFLPTPSSAPRGATAHTQAPRHTRVPPHPNPPSAGQMNHPPIVPLMRQVSVRLRG